jgi:hypothetical protein
MSDLSPFDDWLPIPGYESLYEVCRAGFVWSLPRIQSGNGARGNKMLAPGYNIKSGYPYVSLCRDGTQEWRYVHDLVLTAFVRPCPPGMEACHYNDFPWDNRWPENLRWDTRIANHQDADRNDRTARGEQHGQAKLTEASVRDIRARYDAGGVSQTALALEYGIGQMTVSWIVRRKTWAHVH